MALDASFLVPQSPSAVRAHPHDLASGVAVNRYLIDVGMLHRHLCALHGVHMRLLVDQQQVRAAQLKQQKLLVLCIWDTRVSRAVNWARKRCSTSSRRRS